MRTTLASLPLLLVMLVACPGDDEDTSSTTDSMATTTSTEPTTGPATETNGTDTGSSTQGAEGETTTGSGPEVCETCDPTTEICFASIFDGPTEYSCRPIPDGCTADVTCDCITPIECPRSLQSCELEGELVVVECVEG